MLEETEVTSESLYDNNDLLDPTEAGNRFFDKTTFNHQHLAMLAYIKVINAGSKEMKKGYWETKRDKFNNVMNVYHPDTRLELIGCIKTLDIITIRDLDSKYRAKINELKVELNKAKEAFAKQEDDWYQTLNGMERKRIPHLKGTLNQDLAFYQAYVNQELLVYQEIMKFIEAGLSENSYFQIPPAEITNPLSMSEQEEADAISEDN